MRLRHSLAGILLALSLSACSGGTDDAAPAATESAAAPAAAAAPTDAATPEARDSPTPTASATPTPTPSVTPAPTPTPTPTKIAAAAAAAAAPPASWARCAVCHDAAKGGEDKLGPNLWGTYGAKAGQGSFAFSDALKSSGLTWTEDNLHKWIENPRALVPGNRMSFPGIKDAAKRQEIIDFLKQQR